MFPSDKWMILIISDSRIVNNLRDKELEYAVLSLEWRKAQSSKEYTLSLVFPAELTDSDIASTETRSKYEAIQFSKTNKRKSCATEKLPGHLTIMLSEQDKIE